MTKELAPPIASRCLGHLKNFVNDVNNGILGKQKKRRSRTVSFILAQARIQFIWQNDDYASTA